MKATELKTTDYYWVNALVADNTYLQTDEERRTAKAAMIASLHWAKKQDALWDEHRSSQKKRGLVIETKPLEL